MKFKKSNKKILMHNDTAINYFEINNDDIEQEMSNSSQISTSDKDEELEKFLERKKSNDERKKNLIIDFNSVSLSIYDNKILLNVNVEIKKKSFVYLIGSVGSGKSTFLKSLYAEIKISQGKARVFDYNLCDMKSREIPDLRKRIGIVFQDFQLLIDRTVYKNLEFVLKATGWKNKREIKKRIKEVLDQVGMQNKDYKYPHELSGGEQQRIAIARALLNSPELILADEPTGNLDPTTGNLIIELLYKISQEGTTVMIATHNYGFVKKYSGRIFMCENGTMQEVGIKIG